MGAARGHACEEVLSGDTAGGGLRLVTHALLDELADRAARSPRRRAHHELHGGAQDPLQRFLVVARGDSYFQPHRHRTGGELATVLRGRIDFLAFDDDGRVLDRQSVGEGSPALTCEALPGTWHTLVPRSDVCAFLEVKLGPYDPATAKVPAPWGAAEGAAGAAALRAWLETARVGERFR